MEMISDLKKSCNLAKKLDHLDLEHPYCNNHHISGISVNAKANPQL